MAMVAFFPWFHIEEKCSVADYTLVPYVKGQQPGGEDKELQGTLDTIFKPFHNTMKHSVTTATLVGISGHGLTDDLDEDEKASLFSFAEAVAFAGLANRKYFGSGFEYWNRDNFKFYIQSFSGNPGGVTLQLRRRDGSTLNHVTPGAYRVDRPPHVSDSFFSQMLDLELLTALVQCRETSLWPRIIESITAFNNANTDRDEIPQPAELVMLVGAFERLMDLNRGKKADLIDAIQALLSSRTRIDIACCSRLDEQRRTESATVLEAWISDIYKLRSKYAHGEVYPNWIPAWPVHEHLLLGSHIFVMAVKELLRIAELYKPTEDDELEIHLIEPLLSEDLFTKQPDEEGKLTWPWDHLRSEAMWERTFAKAAASFDTIFDDWDVDNDK